MTRLTHAALVALILAGAMPAAASIPTQDPIDGTIPSAPNEDATILDAADRPRIVATTAFA